MNTASCACGSPTVRREMTPLCRIFTPSGKLSRVVYLTAMRGKFHLDGFIGDIPGHRNESAVLLGQLDASLRKCPHQASGRPFTQAEIGEFNEIAKGLGEPL